MQTIYLDISRKGVIPCIEAKQSEVGRKFLAVISDCGVPYNIPDNSLLSVWYEGDTDAGNYSSIDGKSAFSIDGNKVTVELVAQMLLSEGNGELCLSISNSDGSELNTWNIPYCVECKPGAGSSVPTEYYTALTESASMAAEQVSIAKDQAMFAKNHAENAEESAISAAQSAKEAETKAANAANARFVEFADLLVPVGYVFRWDPVYGSDIDLTTPEKVASHFGFGTWEQIKDVFLLSAGDKYAAGSVGGDATHTLTVDEIPSHTHDFIGTESTHNHISFVRDSNATAYPENKYFVDQFGTGETVDGWRPGLSIANAKQLMTEYAKVTPYGEVEETGGNNAHSIMPPYKAVYTWKRIA